MCKSCVIRLTLGWAMACAASFPSAVHSQEGFQASEPGQRYVATAVDLDKGHTSQLSIIVDRWSSEAERHRLMATVLERGAQVLLETLRDLPRVGYLQLDRGIGWDLHFAQRIPDDEGGVRVILGTDRPVSFWEPASQTSIAYPFTIIELRLKDGHGDGALSTATRIVPDKAHDIVVLENYEMQRIRLTQVHSER